MITNDPATTPTTAQDVYSSPEFRARVLAFMDHPAVKESVASAPPLTEGQRERLAALFATASAREAR